jgi:O-antigen/teichoic acid export membrane protein
MASFYNTHTGTQRGRVQEWLILLISIWFFISPWVLQFVTSAYPGTGTGGLTTAAGESWVLSLLLLLVALSKITRTDTHADWVYLILGVWIFVAPWVLGFTVLVRAKWDHYLVGAGIIVMAAAGLRESRGTPKTSPNSE